MENAWNHIPAVIEAHLQFSNEKSFGTTLFYYYYNLFFNYQKNKNKSYKCFGGKTFRLWKDAAASDRHKHIIV